MASLRDLGLSEYESRAYRSLLETGPTTAKELSRVSDVPMGRIYDVLNSLETQNLVRSQTASRPKKYAGVEPETALDRLLDDKKRELEEKASQYEEMVETLADDLEAADPVGDTFWTTAIGAEETADLLVERLAAADDRIVVVASTFSQQFDLDDLGERVVDGLEDALDRGVEVELLMRPQMIEDLPRTVGERYRTTLQPHENFAVRTSPDVTSSFELIDDTEVCIEVPHPLDAGGTFAVIDFKDPDFAASVREEFDERWANAEALRL
ncbi:TrmB family transcriptional regulator [Halapricum sp. CBA1109]|uniref:TrmB family transcriptional regulator n=1 Tax=Halapricum sp. CBA1109 TaxID=2668068 RepID=UPI0012FB3595|nr:helix-turn-helix domain-containing protein [Halapricum sp. CBA1109]MUV89577.1 TrmB family transcriptional regulator [Halapricum sp. CBA1109]